MFFVLIGLWGIIFLGKFYFDIQSGIWVDLWAWLIERIENKGDKRALVLLKEKEEPYENKYMEKYKKARREIEWTESEKEDLVQIEKELTIESREQYDLSSREIKLLRNRLMELEDMEDFQNEDDLEEVEKEKKEIEKTMIGWEEKRAHDLEESIRLMGTRAKERLLEKRLNHLKNNVLIEKTPLGNVIMFYDHSKGSFGYYSDNTIPYRFLETVSRKYVNTYQCKYIYVDMEEELKEAEKRREEKKQQKEREEEERKRHVEKEKGKKDVFAKFKNYNKDGLKTAGIVKKNQLPQVKVNVDQPNQDESELLLKESANRYTWEGRFLDYNILKKVDRRVNDKRLAMSFSDFKKMKR